MRLFCSCLVQYARWQALPMIALGLSLALAGCREDRSPAEAPAPSSGTTQTAPGSSPVGDSREETAPREPVESAPAPQRPRVRRAQIGSGSRTSDADRLAESFMRSDDSDQRFSPRPVEMHAELAVDDNELLAAGIRILDGKHVTIYTDLPPSEGVDDLPQAFDAIFPQWCEYFGVDPNEHADWQINGVVMKDGDKMRSLGLFPEDLPPFHNGFFRGDTFWVWEQPSDFYRRHLVLHEGTHGFMLTILGGAGPPWYMEGMAEYFGTHTWDGQTLKTRVIPESREESLMWGRIKIIRDDIAQGQGQGLVEILRFNHEGFLKNRPYGWSWGAVVFFDQNPLTQEAFREMRKLTRMTGGFSERLFDRLGGDWPEIAEQWQLFITDLDYGYQFEHTRIDYRSGQPLTAGSETVTIRADQGWQSSGVELTAGTTYRISAEGRYEIKTGPPVWDSEAGGVTLAYHRGQPLGVLLGAVRPDKPNPLAESPLAFPEPIGLEQEITPQKTGTLYLKVNQSPVDLPNSQGSLKVTVEALP